MNFKEQIKARQASLAKQQSVAEKPVSEMNEAELDKAVAQAKQEVQDIKREDLLAAREALSGARARPRFIPRKRRPGWR